MPSAKVLIAEIDRSSRVPESNGVYGFMSIPLVKGDTQKAGFATNEEQFLTQTTPEGRIEPNMDLGYYVALDFLRRSNKLYYARAHNNALYAGLILPAEGTSAVPTKLPTGLVDPLTYNFKTNELVLLYPSSEGDWGKHVSVTIEPNTKETNAFDIVVYWKGALKERWPVSRSKTAKSGFGQSLYLVNVLKASQYIRAIDNAAVADTIKPKYIAKPTTTWNATTTTQAFVAASIAVAKEVAFTVSGSNMYAGPHPLAIAGITLAAEKGATAERTAEQIALANTLQNAHIDAFTATGGSLNLKWKVGSGDVANPAPFMNQTPATTPAGSPSTPVIGKAATLMYQFIVPGYAKPEIRLVVDGKAVVYNPDELVAQTADQIAANFVALINSDATLSYAASNVGPAITLTRKTNGEYTGSINVSTNLVNLSFAGATPGSFTGGGAGTPATANFTLNGEFDPAHIKVSLDGTEFTLNTTSSKTASQVAQDLATQLNAATVNQLKGEVSGTDKILITAKSTGVAGNAITNSYNTATAVGDGGNGGMSIVVTKALGGGVNRVAMSPGSASDTTAVVEISGGRYSVEPQEGMTVAKVFDFTCGGNNTGTEQLVIVEGVEITIPAAATVASAVASAIAAQSPAIIAANPAIASVVASGNDIQFTYTVNANMVAAREPRISNTAAIGVSRIYTSQAYSPAIAGVKQVEEIHVTSTPTVDGTILVAGLPVAVLVSDGRPGTAAKIGAAFNARPEYVATISGEKVTVTHAVAGPKTRFTLDPQSTGTGLASQLISTGVADIPAVPKKSRISFSQGNVYKSNLLINIADVNCSIGGSDDTAVKVVTRLGQSEGWIYHPQITNVTASGTELEIEWTAESGDHADPEIWSGLTKYVPSAPTLVKAYSAATVAVPEIQEVRVNTGNTSGNSEIIFLNDQPISVDKADTTPAQVVSRIVAEANLANLPDIDTLTVSTTDSRILRVTYKASAGDAADIKVQGGNLTSAALGGGTDGGAVTNTHMIASLSQADSLNFNIAMDSGWASPGYQKELADRARKRMDHIAVLSVPYASENASDYMTHIVDYRVNQLNLDSSYAALFTGHLKITDKFNDRELWIPPSGAVGALASNTITKYEPWYPFAGDRRGMIDWPTDVRRHFTEGEMDLLVDNQVNPILFDPGRGIKLWGQSTLQSRPSATDRINVRLLLIYVEMAMKEYLRNFHWELNDEDTRSEVVAGADSFMEGVKTRKGVYAYKNICDTTNNSQQDIDNYRLNFHQLMEPVKGIEQINYFPTIMRTGTI